MKYNWINPKDYTMNAYLLLDRWCLALIFEGEDDEEYVEEMAKAFYFYPHVKEFVGKKAPECANFLKCIEEVDCSCLTAEEARKYENLVLGYHETFIVYAYPQIMDKVNYITNWSEENLYLLADFNKKVVLDVGAGTGRLAFAAAKKAKSVYASEPCDQLREYMRDRIKSEKISNVRVLDGFVTELPFEDNTFDIVTCGHVIGDFYDEEIAELSRVTKNGGYIVSCNGDDEFKRKAPDKELLDRGFTYRRHESIEGGIIFDYVKQVNK